MMKVQTSSEDICQFLYTLARDRMGENVWLELNNVRTLIVQNISDADYILRRNYTNYEKNMVWFKQALGTSRFFENGTAWKKHKNLTQPYLNSFDDKHVLKLSIKYGREALDEFSSSNQPRLNDKTFREMAMAIFIESFFFIPFKETGLDIESIAELMAYSSAFSFIPANTNGSDNREKIVKLRRIRRRVRDSLAMFRNMSSDIHMINRMINAESEQKSKFIMEDEIMTFLAAGSESTAAAMSWICYLLACNPSVQESLHQEVISYPEPKCWGDLIKMQGLLTFISESVRHYPPVPLIIRQSLSADVIGSEQIGEKENIIISFIGIMHDEQQYQNPWGINITPPPYCPLKDKNSALNLAFSRGPRICGGKDFALIEMASLVYIFLKYACFSLTSDSLPVFHWRSQLLCKDGQPVKVILRSDISRR